MTIKKVIIFILCILIVLMIIGIHFMNEKRHTKTDDGQILETYIEEKTNEK